MSREPISLTDKLAQHTHQSKASAAEAVDRIVHDILRKVKSGKSAVLPGLGVFQPGGQPSIRFIPARPPGPPEKGGRGSKSGKRKKGGKNTHEA
jgi:hypothetical protein